MRTAPHPPSRPLRFLLATLASVALTGGMLVAATGPADAAARKFTGVSKPKITGTKAVGQKLTAKRDTSTKPKATKVTYQWLRNGKSIKKATKSTYALTSSDRGKKVSVKVCYKKSKYSTRCVGSSWTAVIRGPLGPDRDLRVGTFNLSGSNTDGSASGDHEVWATRMPKVVSQLLGERSDVVGLQEAWWGGDVTQYEQLVGALNAEGGRYAVTDVDKGESAGTRILYNTGTLRLLDHGTYTYQAQTAGRQIRHLVWATFQDVASGRKFFFADTHLDPYSANNSVKTVKVAQWRELVKAIPRLNTGKLPVVTVGDFNTSKWWSETKETLPAMKAAGFGDVMGQQYQTNPSKGVRAEKVVNGWVNSFNGFRRDVSKYSYPTRHDKVGNGVDWIFATNSLSVKQWKVVIDFNPSTLKVNGVIPSDHNMLSAIVVL